MKVKRLIFCLILIVFTSLNLALAIKAAIGIGAYDSFQKTLNAVTHIKVGTISMAFNITCVLIQLIILRKKAGISILVQIPMNILIGVLINFFLYDVFGEAPFPSYIANIAMMIAASLANAFYAGALLMTGIITFSLEGACNLIAGLLKKPMNVIRMSVDVFCIIASVLCTLLFAVPLTIREGTIISMIAFGPMLGIFMKVSRPLLEKHDLADPV